MPSKSFSALDPVVALVAHQDVGIRSAEDEVVARTGEHFLEVRDAHEEVLAVAAEQKVEARVADDHVVAAFAAQEVIAERILDDVVAVAAKDVVGFHSRVQVIVASIAPERIDALVAIEAVIALGAAEHDVFATGKLQYSAIIDLLAVGIENTDPFHTLHAHDLGIDGLQERIVMGGIEHRCDQVDSCRQATNRRCSLPDRPGCRARTSCPEPS